MNDDYARYRRRRGASIMKRAAVNCMKVVVGGSVGIWLAGALHDAGTITAGDENLLMVVLMLWVSYRVLLAVAKMAYGQWIVSMPPAGELVDGLRQRVEARL